MPACEMARLIRPLFVQRNLNRKEMIPASDYPPQTREIDGHLRKINTIPDQFSSTATTPSTARNALANAGVTS